VPSPPKWKLHFARCGNIGVKAPTNELGQDHPTGSAFQPHSEVPLAATLPLFATGLGGLGLLGWRRKRKARKQSRNLFSA
jgi:hypothetical protein